MTEVRVAYLISRYPGLSLTFIEREIHGLRELGAEVRTISVRPALQAELLTSRMRGEAARTTVLLASRKRLVRAVVGLLCRHPRALPTMMRHALGQGAPAARTKLWQLFYLVEAVRLHEEMRRADLRHVHVHFANNGADIARLAVALGRLLDGESAGWRWTMTMHGPTEFEDVTWFDLRRKVADADAVACISDFTRSQLMRMTDPAEWDAITVVPMSAETDRFLPGAQQPGGRRMRILYVGRLVPEKGAPVLLRAVRQVVDSGRDVEVRIVGAGPLEETLTAEVEKRSLGENVTLVGGVGQDALPELFQWADAFCLPSFQEGLPVVLMEAMASGLPVVTTRIAGIPELIDDTNGILVAAGRVDQLADALAQLCDDPDRREALGRAGRERVQRDHSVSVATTSQLNFLRAR